MAGTYLISKDFEASIRKYKKEHESMVRYKEAAQGKPSSDNNTETGGSKSIANLTDKEFYDQYGHDE